MFVPMPHDWDVKHQKLRVFSPELKDTWERWFPVGIYDSQDRRVDAKSIPCLQKLKGKRVGDGLEGL